MGRIGKIDSSENTEVAGAKVKTVYVDTGGNINLTGDVYSVAGNDSFPVDSDYAVLIPVPGGYACIGFADPINGGEAEKGEFKQNGRSEDGEIISYMWLKNNGDIEIQTIHPITEENAGNITVSNSNGEFKLKFNGQFNANGNFTVDP